VNKALKRTVNTPLKEITMNAFASMLYRDLTCAAAAALISLIVGMSFVQSTALAPAQTAPVVTQQS
jgi:hypothetical protein